MVLIIRSCTNISNLSKFWGCMLFFYEFSEKGLGYSYVLPCTVTNECLGQVTGLTFCLYVKTFKERLFSLLEGWNHEQLFSTLKVFAKELDFIVKNFALATKKIINIFSYYLPIHKERSFQVIKSLTSGFLSSCTLFCGKRESILTAFCKKS